ncbi:ArsA family ATPase [Flexivirga meconopsidis]|uniref:ArsA family ATPase n=1 Tax=Flexivirga meconopsidis TaxID=2977121 RepID=UPI00223F0646|nr:hypothetical protein [Flexivirga meconopsidis]
MSPSVQLVCGPGGAGASTVAARLAAAVADAGRPVTLLALDPYDGATAHLDDPRVRTVAADLDLPADGGMPDLLSALGLPGDLLDDFRATSTAAQLRLLWSVPTEAGGEHVVVVDAGHAGPELARLVRTLPRTLRRLTPLGGGLLRSRRPLVAAAIGDRWPGAAITDALGQAADRAAAVRRSLCGPTGGAVIVGDVDDPKTTRHAVGVALSGVRVRHTAVGSGAPDVAALLAPGEQVIDIQARGDGYLWRMPLPLNDFRQLRLRLVDDALELSALGHRTVVDLPTALRRCHPSGAQLRDGMLEVAFDPSRQQGAGS